METLELSQTGRVVVARYADPPSNFVTAALIRDLDLLTKAVEADPSVGAVVLTGGVDGRFLGHAEPSALRDTSAMAPRLPAPLLQIGVRALDLVLRLPGADTAAERFGGAAGVGAVWAHRWRQTILRMNSSGAVYLSAINGPALGGGFELALACDLRCAADDARIVLGNIEILAGLSTGGGASQRLARMLGTARTLDLLLDGATLTVQQALQAGIVEAVVPPAELLEYTCATAARLATRPRTAVRAVKHSVYFGASQPLSQGLRTEAAAFLGAASSATAHRRLTALVDDVAVLGDTPFLARPQSWRDGTRVGRKYAVPEHDHGSAPLPAPS
ncbi:enoyl-CoA hydratase/isomerase family protein [Nocardia brasiliensis]|uniref:enoyl-CoA hydratase/isomerase family protein n=1 Tax=Nocardia brasiliensis TaxID=37326 RepID=UPI0024584B0B|nr:enoyl-CoA hydratase-related protein [Nocardia brasiliensis]